MSQVSFNSAQHPLEHYKLNHPSDNPLKNNQIQFRVGDKYLNDFSRNGIERFIKENDRNLSPEEVTAFIQTVAANAESAKGFVFQLEDPQLGLFKRDEINTAHISSGFELSFVNGEGSSEEEVTFVEADDNTTFVLKEAEDKLHQFEQQVQSLESTYSDAKKTYEQSVRGRERIARRIGDDAQQQLAESQTTRENIDNEIALTQEDQVGIEEDLQQAEESSPRFKQLKFAQRGAELTLSSFEYQNQEEHKKFYQKHGIWSFIGLGSNLAGLEESNQEVETSLSSADRALENLNKAREELRIAQSEVSNIRQGLPPTPEPIVQTPQAVPSTTEQPVATDSNVSTQEQTVPASTEQPVVSDSNASTQEQTVPASTEASTPNPQTSAPVATNPGQSQQQPAAGTSESTVQQTNGQVESTTPSQPVQSTQSSNQTQLPEGAVTIDGQPLVLQAGEQQVLVTLENFKLLPPQTQFQVVMKADKPFVQKLLESVSKGQRAAIRAQAQQVLNAFNASSPRRPVPPAAYPQQAQPSRMTNDTSTSTPSTQSSSPAQPNPTPRAQPTGNYTQEEFDRASTIISIIDALDGPPSENNEPQSNTGTPTIPGSQTPQTPVEETSTPYYFPYLLKDNDTINSIAAEMLKNPLRAYEINLINPDLFTKLREQIERNRLEGKETDPFKIKLKDLGITQIQLSSQAFPLESLFTSQPSQ